MLGPSGDPSDLPDFDRIVDDQTPRAEAINWAVEQFRAGRTFEETAAEMVEQGWDADDAHALVEEARKATRAERGVVTREQVARTVNANYRSAMGGGIFAGMPAVAALRRLLFAVASLKFLRRRR